MITKIEGKCEFKGCEKDAEGIAYDQRNRKVGLFCMPHADKVADYNHPEFIAHCPNCGCQSGVN